MPESVWDHPAASHEKIYQLAKNQTSFYDAEAVRTPTTDSTLEQEQ